MTKGKTFEERTHLLQELNKELDTDNMKRYHCEKSVILYPINDEWQRGGG